MTRMLRRDGLFWAITVAVYVFLLGPFAVVGLLSLGGSNLTFALPPPEITLALYQDIPDKYFRTFGVSFAVAAVTAAVATLIGATAALGIVRGRIPGKEVLQALFRVPLQIPLVVTGVVFLQFYNLVFIASGVDLVGSLPGLILAHALVTIPYSVGSVSAVLQRMSPDVEEAAAILGASHWSTFRRVTLPAMRPGIFAGMMYAFITSFGDVPIALFLVSGSYVTLPVEMFQDMQFDFNPALFAVSTLVGIFSTVLIVAMQRLAGLDLVLPSGKG